MEFDGFDWDGGNLDKCQKHGASIAEIESVFYSPVLILPDRENSQGEQRFRAIGNAATGRKIFVVFTRRGGAIRPISARYMHKEEVRSYEKTYPELQDR